jgi:hypothetical protein
LVASEQSFSHQSPSSVTARQASRPGRVLRDPARFFLVREREPDRELGDASTGRPFDIAGANFHFSAASMHAFSKP